MARPGTITANRRTRRGAAALVAVLTAALALTACASSENGGTPTPSDSTTTTAAGVSGTVTVFAASSLTDAFEDIAEDFKAANPEAEVEFNFAASSELATQINEGAPADVFAAASPATMKTVTDAGSADGDPVVFVRNQLVIAVEKGNPLGIEGLDDLTDPSVKVALCAVEVPCGAAAKKAIDAAGLTITPVSFEQNVRAALSKVSLGEVDAALVYRTDAAIDDTVGGVDFPESAEAINDYPIAVLMDAPNKEAAEAFVAWVLSSEGAAVLTEYGFQEP
jgi:molybdate transport system substrate-binding protein